MPIRQQRQIVRFFLLLLISGLTADATELTFRPSSTCKSSYVTVGDIADIGGCDEETRKNLAAIPLMPSPSGGRTRILRAREVQELLLLQGIDVLDIRFHGASRMEIKGEIQAIAEKPADTKTGSLVVMTVRPLRRGEIVRDADVELKKMHSKITPGTRQQSADRLDDVVGMQTNRAIAAGQIVDHGALQRPMVVHRASTVTVYARVGGIQVATKGRALADGALDDVVTIELADNRDKRVAGRVVGLDEVEVFAQGASMSPDTMRPLPVTRKPAGSGREHEQNPRLTSR